MFLRGAGFGRVWPCRWGRTSNDCGRWLVPRRRRRSPNCSVSRSPRCRTGRTTATPSSKSPASSSSPRCFTARWTSCSPVSTARRRHGRSSARGRAARALRTGPARGCGGLISPGSVNFTATGSGDRMRVKKARTTTCGTCRRRWGRLGFEVTTRAGRQPGGVDRGALPRFTRRSAGADVSLVFCLGMSRWLLDSRVANSVPAIDESTLRHLFDADLGWSQRIEGSEEMAHVAVASNPPEALLRFQSQPSVGSSDRRASASRCACNAPPRS